MLTVPSFVPVCVQEYVRERECECVCVKINSCHIFALYVPRFSTVIFLVTKNAPAHTHNAHASERLLEDMRRVIYALNWA